MCDYDVQNNVGSSYESNEPEKDSSSDLEKWEDFGDAFVNLVDGALKVIPKKKEDEYVNPVYTTTDF